MIANEPIWPPIMPTALAARYCSVHPTTLTRAAAAKELRPAGRRGRTLTWRREELDRWLTRPAPSSTTSPTHSTASVRAADTADMTAALDRIRRAARGGAR